MPSVGMRRSTRVFGTRVLHSVRRLWTEPHEDCKHGTVALEENKFRELIDDSADGEGGIDDCHKELWQGDENSASVDNTTESKMEEREPDSVDEKIMDRMCGIVYKRKRKRVESTTTWITEDGRYAKKYVRKQWRTRCRAIESFGSSGCIWDCVRTREVALVVNEASCDCYYWITGFLTHLLSYMARVSIGTRQSSEFMLSKPIFDAYSSLGMLFLQEPITAEKPCVCIVSGSASVMPLFSVNIFAIPPFFVHIQTSMCLVSARFDCLIVRRCESDEESMNVSDDAEEPLFQRYQQNCVDEACDLSTGSATSYINVVSSDNDASQGRQLGQSVIASPNSILRTLQSRNSRNIQKRRSSLRRKRGRLPSSFRDQKAKGALGSELFRIGHEDAQFFAASRNRLLRNPDKRRSTTNIKELKSTLAEVRQDVCTSSCSANLLITDAEKCCRVEGATTAASVIPIPEVQEVFSPVDEHLPFVRPETYITFKDDELTRALMKKTANYDMDSDDEEWLAKLNNEVNLEMEFITPEKFELVIDALEKSVHYSPYEWLDEQAAYDLCRHLERKEVVEVVRKYWIRKRKQNQRKYKRSALVKAFQLYQPRRSKVIPDFFSRKKRSFKRQASQGGRGKQGPLLRAIAAAARDGLEQKRNVHKLQEAKAAVNKMECVASKRRERAQTLMENADLATFKAMMALRIAEAARLHF